MWGDKDSNLHYGGHEAFTHTNWTTEPVYLWLGMIRSHIYMTPWESRSTCTRNSLFTVEVRRVIFLRLLRFSMGKPLTVLTVY